MSWLEDAIQTARQSREQDYGAPLVNFLRTALLWSTYKGVLVTPEDVALMNVLQKLSRQMETFKVDNIIDSAGYLDCLDRMDKQLMDMGYVEGVQWFRAPTFSTSDMERLLSRLNENNL